MIKIVKIRQTCVICPTQYEGKTDDDRPVYIRYRWGYLSVRVGDKGTNVMNAVDGEEIYGRQIGHELDGFTTLRIIKDLTKDVIEWKM
jgi:hypothetical protein